MYDTAHSALEWSVRTESVGVVIPLANEAETVEALLRRILERLGPLDRIFCVVDTVSTDATRNMVDEISKRDNRVKLVWSPENKCVVDAYFSGYRAAYHADVDWILEMDGGFSHLPEQIDDFLLAARDGFDFICGSRFMPGGSHDSPPSRVFISWVGTVLARLVLGSEMSDMTSGYEMFNRKAMKVVLETGVQSRANFFQTEIRHYMHAMKWKEIPIHYSNRNASVGRGAVGESLRILWSMRQNKSKPNLRDGS